MKRKDYFFGIHFDFHALEGQVVPTEYRPDGIARMLDEVKPDFVQCDTKGHAGLFSYPTKVGTPAAGMEVDLLATWRKLTRERGILLYAHHSGLYDWSVIRNHPEWAVVNEDGSTHPDFISPFSPYAEEYLVPSLLEMACDYGLDGAWVDGECWAACVDYSPWALAAWKEETGLDTAPKGEDEGYQEYRAFCRRGFNRYVQRYVDAVKRVKPDFEITSNWIYSAYMPEEPTVKVDFLSGDFSSVNSVTTARFEARCLASRGFDYDLLAWGHHAMVRKGERLWATMNRNTKTAVQQCQEAAMVLSLGGGFYFYNWMYGTGGVVQEWAIPSWKEIGDFCRARREFCFRVKPVPEIGVLYASETSTLTGEKLYVHSGDRGYKSMNGWISLLQNTQHSSTVLYEYQLKPENLKNYKVVVVPGSVCLAPEAVTALTDYVRGGGKLVVDSIAARFFDAEELGATLRETEEPEQLFVNGNDALAALDTTYMIPEACEADVSGVFYESNYYQSQSHPAAILRQLGRGRILTLCIPLGEAYRHNVSPAIHGFLKEQFRALGYRPTVRVQGSGLVDVALTKKKGRLLVQLVNMAGNHQVSGVRGYDEIPPIGPLTVKIRLARAPKSVTLEPEHRQLEVTYENGVASVTVERLEIHSTLVVEPSPANES